MKKTSIIICDDHPIFRQGLIRIVEADESLSLSGECGDGETALKLIQKLQPEIAFLDVSMPGQSGISVACAVKEKGLSTRIIILTMHKEEEYFNEAMDAGVMGYLLKENAVSDLPACIKSVISDKKFISPLLTDLLIKHSREAAAGKNISADFDKLSEMELKVLKLIAENKTSKEIAAELFISFRTVQNHRQHISDKLALHGPHKLLQFAIENRANLY